MTSPTMSQRGKGFDRQPVSGARQSRAREGAVAERVGFEPTSRFLVNTLSKRAPSAARTPLRDGTILPKAVRRRCIFPYGRR